MCIKSIDTYTFICLFALSIPHLKEWAFRAFICNCDLSHVFLLFIPKKNMSISRENTAVYSLYTIRKTGIRLSNPHKHWVSKHFLNQDFSIYLVLFAFEC